MVGRCFLHLPAVAPDLGVDTGAFVAVADADFLLEVRVVDGDGDLREALGEIFRGRKGPPRVVPIGHRHIRPKLREERCAQAIEIAFTTGSDLRRVTELRCGDDAVEALRDEEPHTQAPFAGRMTLDQRIDRVYTRRMDVAQVHGGRGHSDHALVRPSKRGRRCRRPRSCDPNFGR